MFILHLEYVFFNETRNITMKSCTDHVSPELRLIEQEIDNYYRINSLTNISFSAASWYFMSFCEDISVAYDLYAGNRQSLREVSTFVDKFVVSLNHPFIWLWNSCIPGGRIPFSYDEDYYVASKDLLDIGDNYINFESAFTYASRGLVDLKLEENTIGSSPPFGSDSRYEAYDILVNPINVPSDIEIDKLNNLIDIIEQSLKINGEKFHYQLNPKVVNIASELLTTLYKNRFTLPEEWQLTNYNIREFRKFFLALEAISYVHFLARLRAVQRGCVKMGYSGGIFVATEDELLRRLVRYSGLSEIVVTHLIADFTYGNRNILKPDPAIQPLIKINERNYAIMPSLVISSSMERNFTILLNKLPSEKNIYLKLVDEKEGLMREKIKNDIVLPCVRYYNGDIIKGRGLGDIDLAIINDEEKACLFLELKWFIAPSEPRELIEKSEEINRGVTQLVRLSEIITKEPQIIFNKLKIDMSYRISFAVVSENSIGLQNVQHHDIPVIQVDHFTKKINLTMSILEMIEWLTNRSYLPIEGVHYNVVDQISQIGMWSLRWYGIEPLVEGEYE